VDHLSHVPPDRRVLPAGPPRTALAISSDASPLLITYRITADADQHRPLLCEELKAPAKRTPRQRLE